MSIMDVEAGVCSGIPNQLHDLCIVAKPELPHSGHIVDVIRNGNSDVF